MAGNEIKLTLRVDDDGSLNIVGKKAKQAADATDKLDKSTKKVSKSRSNYNKQEKGVAGATSNSTKAFSKMRGEIGGGLVPAYAVLAANVFAVTAAFGALQRAAQVEQLQAGLTALGTASGVAMNAVSRSLQEATGNALSLEEAMRSTALVISSGFDASTVDDLGRVAKNASIALGRDMGDSIARLTRGAAKLEPELLDELGIMVRLDEATEQYALKIGKTASELTNFEKRQAFMNAVLEEGDRKFKALGDSVDANPYDKLSASFQDLTKSGLSLLNLFLTPVVSFLASSTTALVGVFTLFGTTVLKAMAPSITELGARYQELSEIQEGTRNSTLSILSGMDNVPKAFKKGQEALQGTSDKTKVLNSMFQSADRSVKSNTRLLRDLTVAHGVEAAVVKNKHADLAQSIKLRNAVTLSIAQQEAATLLLAESEVAGLISVGEYGAAQEGASELFKKLYKNTLNTADSLTGRLPKAIAKANGAFAALMLGGRLLVTTLIQILPLIGGIAIAAGALILLAKGAYDLTLNAFGLTEATENLNDATKKLKEISEETANTLRDLDRAEKGFTSTISTTSQAVEARVNAFKGYSDSLQNVVTALDNATSSASRTNARIAAITTFKELLESNEELRVAYEETGHSVSDVTQRFGTAADLQGTLRDVIETTLSPLIEQAMAFNNLSKSLESADDAMAKFYSTLRVKTPYDEVVTGLQDIEKSLKGVAKTDVTKQLRIIAEQAGSGLGEVLSDEALESLDRIKKAGVAGRINISDEEQKSLLSLIKETLFTQREVFSEVQNAALQGKQNIEIAESQLRVAKQRVLTEKDAIAVIDAENKVNLQNFLLNENDLALLEAKRKERELTVADEAKYNVLLQKRAEFQSKFKTLSDRNLAIARANVSLVTEQQKGAKALLDIQNKLLASQKKEQDSLEKLARIRAEEQSFATGRGFTVTATQEAKISQDMLKKRTEAIEAGEEVKNKSIDLEFTLLRARLQVIRAEAALINAQDVSSLKEVVPLGPIDEALASLPKAQKAAVAANAEETKALLAQATNENNKKQEASRVYLATLAEQDALNVIQLQQQGQIEINNLAQKMIDARNSSIAAERTLMEEQAKSETLAGPLKQAIVTAQQQAEIDKELQTRRIEAAGQEMTLKRAQINMEYDLLDAKLALAEAEAKLRVEELKKQDPTFNAAPVLAAFENARSMTGEARNTAVQATVDEYAAAVVQILREIQDSGQAAMDEVHRTTRGAGGNITSPTAAFDQSVPGLVSTLSDEDANIAEKTAALSNSAMKLQETLTSFGTESPVVTQALESANLISNAWVGAFESIDKAGDNSKAKSAAILGAIANTLSAVGSIMDAASQKAIAGIDSQIAAEKKRDGQSAQSVAKIAGLEKKKDAMARKQFEQNKKLQMAQVVISTGASIMGILANESPKFGALAIPLAMMAGAIGAAQLAMIASTSYQGGGSISSGGNAPSSVSMGKRSNVVDVSQRASGGELAYLRGARGVGTNANDFTPAFTGAKYRASGGETAGYVVGEQGPELFVPETPGRIVPNDDIAQAAPVNVTFSVQAIDANSFNDALATQRGNIISMIREAANSSGEGFLETVDTDSLQMER